MLEMGGFGEVEKVSVGWRKEVRKRRVSEEMGFLRIPDEVDLKTVWISDFSPLGIVILYVFVTVHENGVLDLRGLRAILTGSPQMRLMVRSGRVRSIKEAAGFELSSPNFFLFFGGSGRKVKPGMGLINRSVSGSVHI